MAKETTKKHDYVEGIGRRKTAIARVRLTPHSRTTYVINQREFENYFPVKELREIVESPLKFLPETHYMISARILGGGQNAQAEAMRLGISRALLQIDGALRKTLKEPGFLKRDARKKERKKFGLRKARRAPQWSKR